MGEGGQAGRDHRFKDARPGAKNEDLGPTLLLSAEVVKALQLTTHKSGEPPPRRSEDEAFSNALRQLGSEELLKLADLTADLALPDHIARCGFGDAPSFSHFQETAKPVEGQARLGEERFKHDLRVINIVILLVSQDDPKRKLRVYGSPVL
jgi:hypothetical protein